MTTKIIQLREADDMSKQDSSVGGNFSAVLQEPLYLEKGDSIRMKTAFLSDITANQNTVVFPEDLTVTFYIARYIRDWGSFEVDSNYNTRLRGGVGGVRQPFSNKDFVLCESTAASTAQNVSALSIVVDTDLLKSIKFEHIDISIGYFSPSTEHASGAQTAYINFRASRRELQRRVTEGSGNDKGKSVIILDSSFSVESGKLGFPRLAVKDDFNSNQGPDFVIFKSETSLGRKRKRNHIFKSIRIATATPANTDSENKIFFPWRRPLTIKILKNDSGYMPEELTSIINEQLQAAVTNEENVFVAAAGIDNPLLGTSDEATAKLSGRPFFISTDATEYRQLTVNNWIGSDSLAIIYRDDLQKYQIAQTHLPIYAAQSDGILLLSRVRQGSATLENYVANKAGGIIIESTDPPDFLQSYFNFKPDIFGTFTKSDKITMINHVGEPAPPTGFLNNSVFPKIDLVEGVNVTGHYVNLDALIDKSGTNFESPTAHTRMDAGTAPTSAEISNQSFIAESQMHSIIGETVSNVQPGEAYYQIEISMPVNSDIRGQDNKNNKIQGIVGRYYSKDSYTSSVEGEGAIPYVHQSDDPLVLNSFKVRILNPNGTQMEGLQSDNTVFLEVVKANKSI